MCLAFTEKPPKVPITVERLPTGLNLCYFTLLTGKAVEKRAGVHQTRISYHIMRWNSDPNFVAGCHDRNIHLAPGNEGVLQSLNSYGSHRLVMFPSRHLFSLKHWDGKRCLHDASVFPLGCLDCGEFELEDLSLEDFWKELRLVPPGYTWLPNPQVRLPDSLGEKLFLRRALISPP